MTLTPADVHNVAFSRSHVGKRGYSEQEVDLFIDLVEEELTRHLEMDAELRKRNAELRNRDGGLHKRECELAEREAEFAQREAALRQYETRACQQEAKRRQQEVELSQRESRLRQPGAALAQRETRLRQLEPELAQREAELRQLEAELRRLEAELAEQEAELAEQEAELAEQETQLAEQEAELRQRLDQREPVASCVGVETANHQMARPLRPAPQVRGPLPRVAAVNGASHLGEVRTVASMHGRHDMERMAIRAVTDVLGNTITETVHERMRRSEVDHGGPGLASEHSTQLEQLKEANAELTRSNGLLKAAAALLSAALNGR